jgi:hypothetical protein
VYRLEKCKVSFVQFCYSYFKFSIHSGIRIKREKHTCFWGTVKISYRETEKKTLIEALFTLILLIIHCYVKSKKMIALDWTLPLA